MPSLTETLFAMGLSTAEVVGRTPWCVLPAGSVEEVPVVGGTKTPSLSRIDRLRPDLVVLDREENPKEVWEALDGAGVATFVSGVRAVADVAPMLRSLGERLGRGEEGERLAAETLRAIAAAEGVGGRGPVAIPIIWHNPLMALAPSRYGGDLARVAGFSVADASPGDPYPTVTPSDIGRLGVEALLLTSEPHPFTTEEGEAIADSVAAAGHPRPRPVATDGQALTWFGARTAAGLAATCELRTSLA